MGFLLLKQKVKTGEGREVPLGSLDDPYLGEGREST